MSNYTYLIEADDPPVGLAITLSPGGGGSAATLSFLLVAWDDPDEKDASLARFAMSPIAGNSLKQWAGTMSYVSRISKSIELNDLATITWTPPRRRPHHYALYYQAAASYDLSDLGIKILPSTLVNGNISGATNTLTLPARAAAATYYTARACSWFVPCGIDTGNHYINVRGNWLGYFKVNTSTILEEQSATARTVTAKALYYDAGGEYTQLTVSAGPTAGIAFAKIAISSAGLFCPGSAGAATNSVLFSPTRDIDHQARDHSAIDISGNSVTRSYLNNCPDDMLTIHADYTAVLVAPGGVTPRIEGGALYQMQKWRRWNRELALVVAENDSTIPTGADRWRGTIADTNDYQMPGAQDKDEIAITFKPTHFYPGYYDYGGWTIIAVTAGAATCEITGPLDSRLVAGARVWIVNSTGNNGLYVIASVAASANSHILTFTTLLASSTDDGYLVLEDMA